MPVQGHGRAGLAWGVLAVLGLVLAGCGGSGTGPGSSGSASGGPSDGATTTSSAAAGSGSNGCRTSPSGGSTTLTLTVAGHGRVVIVHVPTDAAAGKALPLVLNMHGSGSDAAQQEALSGMDATADADGFVAAYPQGLIPAGSGFDWNVPGVPLAGGSAVPVGSADDVAFLTQLVPALAARYCIDTGAVFATGLSGGGRMASQLACDASSTFAAVAPVAGLRFPSPCPSTTPEPVLAFHGTADPVDPYQGNGQAYWSYSVPTAAARWAAHDGCSATPATSAETGQTLTSYTGCSGGAAVELDSVTGEGHEWPGGPKLPAAVTRVLGPQSDAVDADTAMWTFFAAHERH